MLILAFDTAGVNRTTVSLCRSSSDITGRSVDASPAEQLVPLMSTLLNAQALTPADVTQVVVGIGPGPFTGLRIGLAHAHSVAHVLGVPVIGVSSLAVIAQRVSTPPHEFVVATDARRKEVYAGLFRDNNLVADSVDVASASVVASRYPNTAVIGDGVIKYAEEFSKHNCTELVLDVDYVTALGIVACRAVADGGLPAFPAYLREPDAVPAISTKSVLT
jgi:tRNA threonylcarbamoyl adenosine modification protein YeaZ